MFCFAAILYKSSLHKLAGALKFIYINVNCVLLCTHKLHFHTLCSLPQLIVKIYNFIQDNDKEKEKVCVCSFKLLRLIFFKVWIKNLLQWPCLALYNTLKLLSHSMIRGCSKCFHCINQIPGLIKRAMHKAFSKCCSGIAIISDHPSLEDK